MNNTLFFLTVAFMLGAEIFRNAYEWLKSLMCSEPDFVPPPVVPPEETVYDPNEDSSYYYGCDFRWTPVADEAAPAAKEDLALSVEEEESVPVRSSPVLVETVESDDKEDDDEKRPELKPGRKTETTPDAIPLFGGNDDGDTKKTKTLAVEATVKKSPILATPTPNPPPSRPQPAETAPNMPDEPKVDGPTLLESIKNLLDALQASGSDVALDAVSEQALAIYQQLETMEKIVETPLGICQNGATANGCVVISALLSVQFKKYHQGMLPKGGIIQVLQGAGELLHLCRLKQYGENYASGQIRAPFISLMDQPVMDIFNNEGLAFDYVGGYALDKDTVNKLIQAITNPEVERLSVDITYHKHCISISKCKLENEDEFTYQLIDSLRNEKWRGQSGTQVVLKGDVALRAALIRLFFGKFKDEGRPMQFYLPCNGQPPPEHVHQFALFEAVLVMTPEEQERLNAIERALQSVSTLEQNDNDDDVPPALVPDDSSLETEEESVGNDVSSEKSSVDEPQSEQERANIVAAMVESKIGQTVRECKQLLKENNDEPLSDQEQSDLEAAIALSLYDQEERNLDAAIDQRKPCVQAAATVSPTKTVTSPLLTCSKEPLHGVATISFTVVSSPKQSTPTVAPSPPATRSSEDKTNNSPPPTKPFKSSLQLAVEKENMDIAQRAAEHENAWSDAETKMAEFNSQNMVPFGVRAWGPSYYQWQLGPILQASPQYISDRASLDSAVRASKRKDKHKFGRFEEPYTDTLPPPAKRACRR